MLPIETVEAFVAEQELVFAVTAGGRYLVEKTLREFEAGLDTEQFARVHRCVIVNRVTDRAVCLTRRTHS